MVVVRFYFSGGWVEMEKSIFRVICDRPLVDGCIHPEDVEILHGIAKFLGDKYGRRVVWFWFR